MTIYHWYNVKVYDMTFGKDTIYGNSQEYLGEWADYTEVKCGSSTATLSDYLYRDAFR